MISFISIVKYIIYGVCVCVCVCTCAHVCVSVCVRLCVCMMLRDNYNFKSAIMSGQVNYDLTLFKCVVCVYGKDGTWPVHRILNTVSAMNDFLKSKWKFLQNKWLFGRPTAQVV